MSARPEAGFRADSKLETLRVPPQSVEAEQAVLGGLMLSPEAWDLIADQLSEDDFYRRDHRLIFRAIAALAGAIPPKPVDAVTVGEWFERNSLAEQIGGSGYLIELASTTPSAANIRSYAEIVRDNAMLRALISAGTEIVNEGFRPEGRTGLQVLGSAQEKLAAVMVAQPAELEGSGVIVSRMLDRQAKRFESGATIEGLSSGFSELDQMLGGLRSGCLYVIAGRPKMGKTTLAMNIAEHAALMRGERVPVHSLEMTPEDLMERSACSVARIPHSRVTHWELDAEEGDRYTRATGRLANSGLMFSRPRSVRAAMLAAQTRRENAKGRLGLVVIDYLQLMDLAGAERRDIGIGDATRELKMLAEVLRVPVILLSQLNRGLESRPDKRPTLSDLRDGGAIEQDADGVVFVYRDDYYHKDSADAGTAELIVGANRHGPTGMVRVASYMDEHRFAALPPDWEPRPQARHDEDGAPRARRGFRKPSVGSRARNAGGDE